MAREQLDTAWPKYAAAIPRIKLGSAALTPQPQDRLREVATLLEATGPVRIRLITFVGTFRRNAFAMGLRDGVSTIAIPLEDSDQDHALDMTHEFTHAVQMQMGGGWDKQYVGTALFTEGLAMRVTEHLNPGLPANLYTSSNKEWLDRCTNKLPAVLADMLEHREDMGATAVSKFTFGTGAAGIEREVYCAGWFVIGELLKEGVTFPQLARLTQPEAQEKVHATILALLATKP
jgi:hypothetical protein